MPLEEHALPAAAIVLHVAHGPALHAAAAPIVLIFDQVGSHSQRQVRGQVVQDLLLVLWKQLVQDRVVFGDSGRKAGSCCWGRHNMVSCALPAWGH